MSYWNQISPQIDCQAFFDVATLVSCLKTEALRRAVGSWRPMSQNCEFSNFSELWPYGHLSKTQWHRYIGVKVSQEWGARRTSCTQMGGFRVLVCLHSETTSPRARDGQNGELSPLIFLLRVEKCCQMVLSMHCDWGAWFRMCPQNPLHRVWLSWAP